MYSDRQAWANSAEPDETPQKAASHQGLHCLPLIQSGLLCLPLINAKVTLIFHIIWWKFYTEFLDTTSGSKL